MWCSKKRRNQKWSLCCGKITVQPFFCCDFTWKKREMLFNKCYGPHVLQERYKGAWPRSTPVLVLAVDVLFKTSKAHQGRLSVFLQECQAFRSSPSGEQSPLLLFGHLSRLHVNKCNGPGRVYLCARWICWLVCNVYQQSPALPPLPSPQPHWIPPLCGTKCVSVSLERQLLRCGNYAEVELRIATGRYGKIK